MSETSRVAIVGAGGFGREVSFLLSDAGIEDHFFLVDREHRTTSEVNGKPVLTFDEIENGSEGATEYVVGVGDPAARRGLAERMDGLGFRATAVFHPSVVRSRWIEVGGGSVVCALSALTTNIVIGRHVHINLGCTVGHDVRIHDFATLSPGVHVSGNVTIEEGAFIGTGAVIIEGASGSPLVIGAGSIVAAAACVTRPVPAGSLVAGVPAVQKR